MLLYRLFNPSSFTIHEAMRKGFVNPITLAVRHPATGQFMMFESALTTGLSALHLCVCILYIVSIAQFLVLLGLLHPKASSITTSSAVPLTLPPPPPNQRAGVRRSESMSKVERRVRRLDGNAGYGSTAAPTMVQSNEFHNYQSKMYNATKGTIKGGDALTLTVPSGGGHMTSNGLETGTLSLGKKKSDVHLVNGKLYAAKPGFIINSNSQVVNLTTGDVMNLVQAERLYIVYRLPDKDHQGGQSYVPASNMMFNRVRKYGHTFSFSEMGYDLLYSVSSAIVLPI